MAISREIIVVPFPSGWPQLETNWPKHVRFDAEPGLDYNLIVIETQSQLSHAWMTRIESANGLSTRVIASMGITQMMEWRPALTLLAILFCAVPPAIGGESEVSGIVRMPDVCSPAVSPAAVYLETSRAEGASETSVNQAGDDARAGRSRAAEIKLVDQRGLQFVPRVQAIGLGQTIRFTNDDAETHNVHVVSPDFTFNQSMIPGLFHDFTPVRAGVMKLACDIHHHMRGYVIVSPTCWATVCDREGRFRLEGVPDGRYVLTAWHEMGDPVRTEITIAGGKKLVVPELVLTSSVGPKSIAEQGRSSQATAPVLAWADVIDRISVTLAASRDAATRAGELAQARRLADDAYWGDFESSDMETAVRKYLGFSRAGELERQFLAIRSAARDVAEKRRPLSVMADLCHKLLLDLLAASSALNAKGVTDRSRIDSMASQSGTASNSIAVREDSAASGPTGNPMILMQALKRGLGRVEQQAERDQPDEAASELTTVYMTDFEPLERYLLGRSPQDVRPLEIQFNALRGALTAGLKGEPLASRVATITSDVDAVIERLEARPVGAFGPAFVASLVTILREGVEIILVVTMLLALVAKAAAGSGHGAGSEPATAGPAHDGLARASRAIWWGVGLASLASVATAVVLNVLVISASGAVREILEGVVMLGASGILFYVSYWLISQAESRRWLDFLKRQARHGLELGGQGTLAVTAFLAVFREGAETSLMYQALLGSEGRTQAGLLGLTAGLIVGICFLAVIAYLIRATSVRLPMHVFFKFSGMFLFALAIVFAGNGVFELQNAGILLTTNLGWLGRGLPWAGLYPNLQVVSVQGLLLAGAILAWLVMPRASLQVGVSGGSGMGVAAK
jgi:high-affinity iron transporter